MVDMEYTGSDNVFRELPEIEQRLLKMIDIRQVNYAYAEDNRYYPVGAINLSDKNGDLSINNHAFANDANFRNNI